jgi:hypothetical protein
MRTTALLFAIVFVPLSAAAQDVAASFEQLDRAQLLKEGATIWIFSDLDGTGEYGQMKAEFVSLTEATISVRIDSLPHSGTDLNTSLAEGKYRIELPEERVRRIDGKLGDPLMNGVVYGAVIGFCALGIPALIQAQSCPGEGIVAELCVDDGLALVIGAVGAGIGGGIGLGVDAARKGARDVVYVDPGSGETTAFVFSMSPIVSKKRKGLLFTLSW